MLPVFKLILNSNLLIEQLMGAKPKVVQNNILVINLLTQCKPSPCWFMCSRHTPAYLKSHYSLFNMQIPNYTNIDFS